MNLDLKTIQQAIKQIAAEKGLSEASIMETINSALAAAYRKDFGTKNQNIIFEFDLESGKMKVYDKKIVVDFPAEIIAEIDVLGRDKKFVKVPGEPALTEDGEMGADEKETKKVLAVEDVDDAELPQEAIKFNPKIEMLLDDAKMIKKSIKVGDELIIPLEIPDDFGRMAAQTAKQVIIQKIREAERENVFNEFKTKEHQLLTGSVQRKEMRGILVDFGKVTALMPMEEQIRSERYNPGDRLKFYVARVEMTIKGAEIIVSRTSPELIKRLFENEIPEINNKSIDIMAIAREAGARSKVAVKSNAENIDPIGSCVGQRGARIQTIINEIGGEKIDIIEWNEDPRRFIGNALSPAKVLGIEVNEAGKMASVTVAEDQLSLAIGKEGQNVRLAAKLTGWRINILKETPSGNKEEVIAAVAEEIPAKVEVKEASAEEVKKEKKAKKVKKEKVKKEKKPKKVSSVPDDTSAPAEATADKKAPETEKEEV
ncbi:MAG: transcription termination factor NusA [Candidatus Parcubacteria bacterium]|nr:transcription termination factor NusA [Candidatus Parcubacteria bacterium]